MFLLNSLIVAVAFGPPLDAACGGPLTRDAVIECATATSPRLRADRERVAAARGEANAARVLLPSNPTAAVTLGRRWNTAGERALNASGAISQRFEVAGQRRKRQKTASAEVDARQHEAETTERDVVAEALVAYYDVLAAREEVVIVERGSATAERLQEVADARASAGLGAPLEADLAGVEAARLREQVALAHGRVKVAEARLASVLGLDPSATPPEVQGSLKPLPTPAGLTGAVRSATHRPELAARQAEGRASRARVSLLKRERIPTPSLSFFVQTDGIDERVIGGGLAFPIPLPFPLGRTNKGRIQAARARVRETDERVAAEARTLTLEATVAYHEFDARRDAASAYPEQTQASARQSLDDLSGEIEQGRLPVRDALLTQQSLIDLLLRAVESRHELCRASVALVLATGATFDGGAR